MFDTQGIEISLLLCCNCCFKMGRKEKGARKGKHPFLEVLKLFCCLKRLFIDNPISFFSSPKQKLIQNCKIPILNLICSKVDPHLHKPLLHRPNTASQHNATTGKDSSKSQLSLVAQNTAEELRQQAGACPILQYHSGTFVGI